ncbi:hypothetical protein N9Y42_10925, partial [Mariniblastus sp.]|nr:hypothetical protein [Mariniblastus sp.]
MKFCGQDLKFGNAITRGASISNNQANIELSSNSQTIAKKLEFHKAARRVITVATFGCERLGESIYVARLSESIPCSNPRDIWRTPSFIDWNLTNFLQYPAMFRPRVG